MGGIAGARAQSVTVINHTGCTFGANIHVSNSAAPCQPVWGQSCGIPVPAIGPFSSYTYIPADAPCWLPPPPMPAPPGAVYPSVDFEWIGIQEPWYGVPPNTNPVYEAGTANCSLYPQTVTISTACGRGTLSWTDLGSGNAQVDIN